MFYAVPVYVLSCVQIFATPWTVALQAPLSIGFPRQENWSESPFPPPGDLPNPGIKLMSPALQMDSLPLSHLGSPHFHDSSGKMQMIIRKHHTNPNYI